MSIDSYVRAITVTRVIDGDTVVADVDLGYHAAMLAVTYRLGRVNAPELSGSTRPAGLEAREFTVQWVADHADHGGLFVASTKTDNWRRWIGEITCGLGHSLGDALLGSGQAVPYVGK